MSELGDEYYPDEPSGYDFGADPANPYGIYSNWGGDTLSAMNIANDTAPGAFDKAIGTVRGLFGDKSADLFKSIGGAGKDFLTSKGGIAALMALLSYLDRQKSAPQGGGTTMAYAGPSKPLTRTMVPGKYGPIAQYAAQGGIMHAYANGGKVQMEDGGFVMTKKAVDGAGGPQGIAQLIPGARPIRGPGTGTSDSIPATIRGPNGITPAKVSNGEAYVPRAAVQQAGGPDRMYEIMRKLQRSA